MAGVNHQNCLSEKYGNGIAVRGKKWYMLMFGDPNYRHANSLRSTALLTVIHKESISIFKYFTSKAVHYLKIFMSNLN